MKDFTPPKQVLDFDLILKYDSEHTPILSYSEKRQIIHAKARSMRGQETALAASLKSKIDFTLAKIGKENWKPENPIRYANSDNNN